MPRVMGSSQPETLLNHIYSLPRVCLSVVPPQQLWVSRTFHLTNSPEAPSVQLCLPGCFLPCTQSVPQPLPTAESLPGTLSNRVLHQDPVAWPSTGLPTLGAPASCPTVPLFLCHCPLSSGSTHSSGVISQWPLSHPFARGQSRVSE